MTMGEARILETDAVIFATETGVGDRPEVSPEKEAGEIKSVSETGRTGIKTRFARLKKSLRKRSVSIL